MASFFRLCLWNRTRTFLSDLSRSTDANRSTFGCHFQSSSFLFHCSFPFFFLETLYRSYSYSSECGYFAQMSWFRQRPGKRLPVLKAQARQRRTARPSDRRGDSSMRSIDVLWQSEVMTPTRSKQRPTATRDPKESATRTRPRQRAPPFRYCGKRSPERQTKQALAITSLSGWRSVSRLLATVVTIDSKAVDRGGCGRWTWRNLCSLGTPHLCPYLHECRLWLCGGISLQKRLIFEKIERKHKETHQGKSADMKIHKNSDQSEVLSRSVRGMVKTVRFRHPWSMQGMPEKDRSENEEM